MTLTRELEGIDEINDSGLSLLEFCTRNNLCITNYYYHHKLCHKATWMHPRSKKFHQIDYIITRQRDRLLIPDTRVFHSVDVWSDHFYVGSSIFIPKCRTHSSTHKRQPCSGHFAVHRLALPEVLKGFQDSVTKALSSLQSNQPDLNSSLGSDVESIWSCFVQAVTSAADTYIGPQTHCPLPDWFRDNISVIQPLLHDKKHLFHDILHFRKDNLPVPPALLSKYRQACNRAKYTIWKIQNKWWNFKAELLNVFRTKGDWKNLFSLWRKLSSKTTMSLHSVRDESGLISITDPEEVRNRWKQHFSAVFKTPVFTFCTDLLDKIPMYTTDENLAHAPSIDEVKRALKCMNLHKAAGKDRITADMLIYGGDAVINALHRIVCEVWASESVPKDWVDSVIVPVPKKGDLHLCDNWRGISLLSVPGKVFSRIIVNRIIDHYESILDETQCGFRKQRGTVDMIFTARQIQDKAREQVCNLYICFFDLKKAYDSVPRDALWPLLIRYGLPSKMVNIIRHLHSNMEASVRIKGTLSEPFKVDTGLKQGCVLAPFLFNMYFNQVMHDVLAGFQDGVEVRYKLDGKLFRRHGTKLPTSTMLCDLRFADDVMASSHTSEGLQEFITRFSNAARSWGLCVSTDKTKVLVQNTSDLPLPSRPVFHIDNHLLETVPNFCYLGSTISSVTNLDQEISRRIAKAGAIFSSLKRGVWYNSNLSVRTKLTMYEATVLPALLYGAETWTAKAHDLHRLDSFHMACLRQALRISPLRHIPDTTIRAMSSSHRASSLVRLARLRWLGHVWRMEDSRIPKMILFSELTRGKRPQHRPFLRWRDCVRHDLQHFGLPTVWHILAAQRHLWRMKILSGCSDYDRALDNRAQLLRACHKGEVSASYCPACNQYFTSDRYLRSHNTQKHGLAAQDNRVQQHSAQTDLSTPFSCSVCNFTSSSTKGIKIHIHRKHPDHPAITVNITGIVCLVSGCSFRSESTKGVKIHLRKSHKWSKELVDASFCPPTYSAPDFAILPPNVLYYVYSAMVYYYYYYYVCM